MEKKQHAPETWIKREQKVKNLPLCLIYDIQSFHMCVHPRDIFCFTWEENRRRWCDTDQADMSIYHHYNQFHSLCDSRHVFHLFVPESFWLQKTYLLTVNMSTLLFACSFEPWAKSRSIHPERKSVHRLEIFDFFQDGCRTQV